ncbi:Protein of unknown function, partial [Gryllus bimaculatus]
DCSRRGRRAESEQHAGTGVTSPSALLRRPTHPRCNTGSAVALWSRDANQAARKSMIPRCS